LQPFLDNQVSIMVATISLHDANYAVAPIPPRLFSGLPANTAFLY
jgi:hypothetical protein